MSPNIICILIIYLQLMMTDQVLDRDKSQTDLDQDRTTIERLTDRDHDKTTTETLIIGTNMDEVSVQLSKPSSGISKYLVLYGKLYNFELFFILKKYDIS